MKPRTVVVLLLVVVALGALLWFFERELPSSEEREERAKLLLPGFEAAEVDAVVLEAGERRVRLVRSGAVPSLAPAGDTDDDGLAASAGTDEWRFAEPASLAGVRADAPAVGELLAALGRLVRERELEDVDEAAVGLDAPRARALLELRDDGPVEIAVGGEVPTTEAMVVRVGGDRAPGGGGVFLVDRSIYGDLTRAEWRARDLFPFDRLDVRALVLTGPAGRVELERRDDGPGMDSFDVVAPFSDRADPEAVDELLTALADLDVDTFRDDLDTTALAGVALDPPYGTIEVHVEPAAAAGAEPVPAAVEAPEPGEPFRVEVGAPVDGGVVHLRVGGQVVTARTLLREPVERPPETWSSRRLTELHVFDLVGLVAEAAGADRLALSRVDEEWQRGREIIEYTAVSDLLAALTDAAAERVTAAGSAGGEPELTLHLRAEDGEEREVTLTFHAAGADGLVPVTSQPRGRVLWLAAETAARIRGALDEVREAETLVETRPQDAAEEAGADPGPGGGP
jgi:hypothetical protein